MKTFGDPGRIQGALDNNRCPRCLVKLPPLNQKGELKCTVCRLVIGGNYDNKNQRFDVLLTRFVYYINKVRSKFSRHR